MSHLFFLGRLSLPYWLITQSKAVLTFNISVNREEFVVFVMPT